MKTTYLLLCLLGIGSVSGAGQTKQPQKIGDFIESTSYNEHRRNATRSLQYTPDGDDFVCINGKNRFTRALYGSHTAFRLETSDRPVFAAYTKKNPKHICFKLQTSGGTVALDSTEHCESRYTAGRRSYNLFHPSFEGGNLSIATLALPDKEGAIWQFNARNFKGSNPILLASISEIRNSKLNRNGDMGADPADSFEAPLQPQQLQSCPAQIDGTLYILLENQELRTLTTAEGETLFKKAEAARSETASRIRIETPDPYFNTLGGTLAMAADGIWDGEVWLHGAIGWRMPLSGWRAAYTGDVLGWHDRARTHFNAYAASQVTEVPNTLPHPAQDSALHLARSVKKWGTPQYSNGYICRNPHRNNQMHHYDMNLCYIDELLWHFKWTGDLDYVRQMWPVITRHLAWEKLNYDPDNDGLYDAYACIWASDALYYNSGGVTHSSAYNYRANKTAAQLAEKIGEDPTPYRNEAEKILKAMNERLWLPGKGHWAEYQDFMGHKRVHESAAVWTIYHAIDSETANPFQAYQATRYIDTAIPHIPVTAHGLKENGYATIATTNWLPYSWSVNNIAFAEVMHTALSYFQAGRAEAGYKLLKSSVLDGMYLGDSPGNFGQISFYDGRTRRMLPGFRRSHRGRFTSTDPRTVRYPAGCPEPANHPPAGLSGRLGQGFRQYSRYKLSLYPKRRYGHLSYHTTVPDSSPSGIANQCQKREDPFSKSEWCSCHMAIHRIGPWLSSSFNPGGRNIFNHHYHRMGRSITSYVGSPRTSHRFKREVGFANTFGSIHLPSI